MGTLIDRNHLTLYVGEDTGLRNEILSIYEEQLEHWVTCLAPSLSDEDWYHGCHTLKGASRGVGVWSIGELAENAEKLVGALDDKEDQRRAMLSELSSLADDVLKEVSLICDGVAA